MDLQHLNRYLWSCICQRIVLLRSQFWHRRYVKTNRALRRHTLIISVGGTATQAWAFRACVIQGTQQLYMAFLWYWGSALTNGSSTNHIARSGIATAITMPIGLSMWVIGVLVFLGLPSYYRNQPGRVPSFYKSILHRKVVLVCAYLHHLLPPS